jgi:hypothetical protein
MASSNPSWAEAHEVDPGDVEDGMHRIGMVGGGAGVGFAFHHPQHGAAGEVALR